MRHVLTAVLPLAATAVLAAGSAPAAATTTTPPSAASSASPSPSPSSACPVLELSGDPDEAGNMATRVGRPLTLVATASDPATTYRLEVTSPYVGPVRDGSGAETRWSVRPSENTDVRVRSTVRGQYGCLSNALRLYVEPAVSIAAERTGVRTYVFRGRVLPGREQLVTLYRQSGRGPVITAQTRVRDDGTWLLTRTFTGSGRFDFFAAVGRSATNLAGRSPARTTVVH